MLGPNTRSSTTSPRRRSRSTTAVAVGRASGAVPARRRHRRADRPDGQGLLQALAQIVYTAHRARRRRARCRSPSTGGRSRGRRRRVESSTAPLSVYDYPSSVRTAQPAVPVAAPAPEHDGTADPWRGTRLPCVIAIDAGTTGVRSRAVFVDGAPCSGAYQEFTQHFPQPGWVEHDAAEIWEAVQARCAVSSPGVGRDHVAAIGITNQRETVVAWDRRPVSRTAPGDRVAGPPHRRALRRARPTPGTCRSCASAPGSCSTRTSPAPRSSGCCARAADPDRAATSPSARSTRG